MALLKRDYVIINWIRINRKSADLTMRMKASRRIKANPQKSSEKRNHDLPAPVRRSSTCRFESPPLHQSDFDMRLIMYVALKFNLTEEETLSTIIILPGWHPQKKIQVAIYLKSFALIVLLLHLHFCQPQSSLELTSRSCYPAYIFSLSTPFLIAIDRRRTRQISQTGNQHVLDESEIILSDSGDHRPDHVPK